MPLKPDTKLGPYKIISPLGAGGTREVFKVRDTRLDSLINTKLEDSSKSLIIFILDWTAAIEEGTSTP